MKKIYVLFFLLAFVACEKKSKHLEINEVFKDDITLLIEKVAKLKYSVQSDSSEAQIQRQFLEAHQSYKKVEMISEYYSPAVSKSINGPAISEFEENDKVTVPPEGFQVIEELVFPKYNKNTKKELLQELGVLSANLIRLEKVSNSNELTDAHVFDAMRLEVYRILTLGITGFDSPVVLNSLPEAQVSLETIEKYYRVYLENNSVSNAKQVLQIFQKGKKYLKVNTNFNAFDRAYFIKEILNPLSKGLYKTQSELGIPLMKEQRGLKVTAQTLFDRDAFDPEAFSGFPDYKTTPEKIALGKKLFNDPILSGNNTRSCASCHHANKAFTDGLERAVALDGKSMIQRNTPTLSNIAFQRVFFADSRVSYLEDQAIAVISNENEMHGSLEKSALALQKNKEYVEQFKKAFPKGDINAFAIKNALASYIRSLSHYDSKFDDYMQNKTSFTADEKAGFNVFAGKGKCATCHFIPLTNGTVPPNFDRSESEVLGVPDKNKKLDGDLGKFVVTQAAIHKYSFKTPTIRNSVLTAPYMHNGVYKTLEEVIDFYNEGGGLGLGLELENQTLPEEKLNLSDKEKMQLIAFMKTLTDNRYLQNKK
ncbi:cytochrome c peroxidase [Flavobacterium sp. Fl-77]|uniref:Cytochrome c peroxidase n=1 Tax=Flavobacterium flavipigmentatum TaxID=2893884 RepID=A0AAJ2SG63_9FLAO|nr:MULTISPECIES: cytochrome c peroxidase [unclassified Flavobacterium]MDX6183291.1 cytochrome c peroxidase [Flavobacterium sp. Fl-33]MDX6186575.1 cytochrome c peroxidase [Flavobacterium sp. Fl-77]UFH38655.1 cytochrome-c peroxidase [Flavobacterium sp. F-70]